MPKGKLVQLHSTFYETLTHTFNTTIYWHVNTNSNM